MTVSKINQGPGGNSVINSLPAVYEGLDLIPSTTKAGTKMTNIQIIIP
jgi:hypothetical protein